MAEMIKATFPAIELRVPDTAERLVEGIVVPWGETSFVTPDPKGERFMPGSLTRTVTERPKVKLFLNHRHDEAVGKAVAWRPEDERGLWARFHIPASEAGDRVLAGVADELLDAFSVGFRPIRVRRAADGAREVLEAALHEVSIAPVGAYDGARVLALRVPMRAVTLPPMPSVCLDPIPLRP